MGRVVQECFEKKGGGGGGPLGPSPKSAYVHSFWCHLVNSNDCSKTIFKYSDFLLLELKKIVGILEFVLPELNIEESRLLAILLDRNSKHAR